MVTSPLPAGAQVNLDHLVFLRHEEEGVSPMKAPALIGKKTLQSLMAYHPIKETDLAE